MFATHGIADLVNVEVSDSMTSRTIWRALILGALVSASRDPLVAQVPSRTIQGVVRDSASGETLPFATVTVAALGVRVASNRDGFFSIVGVPTTGVTLRVTAIGYHAVDFVVSAGQATGGLVAVNLVAIPFELEEIEVVADGYRMVKTSEGVSKIVASPRDLANLPSIGEVDIFRSLQLLPGISGTNESSSGLYVRGGTPDQNLVLLDGMTVYHVDHFFGFFSAFNADAIKDVQVYKGAFPAQYGGRISSVVDMTGKSGDPNNAHLSIGVNLLSSQLSLQVPLFGKGSFVFTARRSYTDVLQTGLFNSIFDMFNTQDSGLTQGGPAGLGGRRLGGRFGGQFANADFTTFEPDFYFYDLNAKLTYNPSVRDVMSVSLYNGQDYLDNSRLQTQTLVSQGTQPTRAISNDVTDLTDWGNKGISGKWARQWHPQFYSNALVAYSEYFSDYTRSTNFETRNADTDSLLISRTNGTTEDNLVQDFSMRLDNELQIGNSHQIGFGGWATRSEVRYQFLRNDSISVLDENQQAWRTALYLQDTWNVRPNLSLTVGGRFAFYDGTGDAYLEPRASLSVGLTSAIRIKAAFGEYHQFVSRVVNENITQGSRDFWLLADNDLVGVTGSTHYVVGGLYETDDVLFDVELYRKTLDGLSEFSLRFRRAGELDISNLFFDGSGVAKGAEFLLQKKFGNFTGWASYTLSKVEHTFDELNDGNPFPALHDQTHGTRLRSQSIP